MVVTPVAADTNNCNARLLDATDSADSRLLADLRSDPQIEVVDHWHLQAASAQQVRPPLGPELTVECRFWAYYPWRRAVVSVLGPEAFRRVRLDRNRNMITADEQELLRALRIGVIGLSVGHAVAYAVAAQGLCGELRLADFDQLELTNLNRVPASVFDLGVNKATVAARRIAELDPYLPVRVMTSGLTPDLVERIPRRPRYRRGGMRFARNEGHCARSSAAQGIAGANGNKRPRAGGRRTLRPGAATAHPAWSARRCGHHRTLAGWRIARKSRTFYASSTPRVCRHAAPRHSSKLGTRCRRGRSWPVTSRSVRPRLQRPSGESGWVKHFRRGGCASISRRPSISWTTPPPVLQRHPHLPFATQRRRRSQQTSSTSSLQRRSVPRPAATRSPGMSKHGPIRSRCGSPRGTHRRWTSDSAPVRWRSGAAAFNARVAAAACNVLGSVSVRRRRRAVSAARGHPLGRLVTIPTSPGCIGRCCSGRRTDTTARPATLPPIPSDC